jgi:hypothetical protein
MQFVGLNGKQQFTSVSFDFPQPDGSESRSDASKNLCEAVEYFLFPDEAVVIHLMLRTARTSRRGSFCQARVAADIEARESWICWPVVGGSVSQRV